MFEPAHIYDSVLKVSLEQWNLNQLAEFAFWVFISRTVFHILCHRVECFGALHMMCKRSKYVLIQSPDRRKNPDRHHDTVGKAKHTINVVYYHSYTSSTAQGGGGSFKNRKPIGEVGCCESGMAERSHWWTERCLRSPLFRSLSLTIYLPTYLSSMYLSVYLSICGAVSFSIM